MADEKNSGDKTHAATPYRRQKGDRRGSMLRRSQDLASAALLVAGATVLIYWGGDLVNYLEPLMRDQLGGEAWLGCGSRLCHSSMESHRLSELARVLLPILGVLVLVAVAVQVGQVGLLWLPEKLGMDINRINPLENYTRIFSTSNVVRLDFGLLKIGFIAGIALWVVWGNVSTVLSSVGMDDTANRCVHMTIPCCGPG